MVTLATNNSSFRWCCVFSGFREFIRLQMYYEESAKPCAISGLAKIETIFVGRFG